MIHDPGMAPTAGRGPETWVTLGYCRISHLRSLLMFVEQRNINKIERHNYFCQSCTAYSALPTLSKESCRSSINFSWNLGSCEPLLGVAVAWQKGWQHGCSVYAWLTGTLNCHELSMQSLTILVLTKGFRPKDAPIPKVSHGVTKLASTAIKMRIEFVQWCPVFSRLSWLSFHLFILFSFLVPHLRCFTPTSQSFAAEADRGLELLEPCKTGLPKWLLWRHSWSFSHASICLHMPSTGLHWIPYSWGVHLASGAPFG